MDDLTRWADAHPGQFVLAVAVALVFGFIALGNVVDSFSGYERAPDAVPAECLTSPAPDWCYDNPSPYRESGSR